MPEKYDRLIEDLTGLVVEKISKIAKTSEVNVIHMKDVLERDKI